MRATQRPSAAWLIDPSLLPRRPRRMPGMPTPIGIKLASSRNWLTGRFPIYSLVPRAGIEPATPGFSGAPGGLLGGRFVFGEVHGNAPIRTLAHLNWHQIWHHIPTAQDASTRDRPSTVLEQSADESPRLQSGSRRRGSLARHRRPQHRALRPQERFEMPIYNRRFRGGRRRACASLTPVAHEPSPQRTFLLQVPPRRRQRQLGSPRGCRHRHPTQPPVHQLRPLPRRHARANRRHRPRLPRRSQAGVGTQGRLHRHPQGPTAHRRRSHPCSRTTAATLRSTTTHQPSKPPANHPWRRPAVRLPEHSAGQVTELRQHHGADGSGSLRRAGRV